MNKFGIKAKVLTEWSHGNTKFKPHDLVYFGRYGGEFHSKSDYSMRIQKHIGKIGSVCAVSCTEDGKIRGMSKYNYPRCFTRYYVKFPGDDKACGIHSAHLEPCLSWYLYRLEQ